MKFKAVCVSGLLTMMIAPALNAQQVVISQIYPGAASNTPAALYQGDYVELFNRGNVPVDITGWSLQYAGSSGSFGVTNLQANLPSAIIAPGRYYLFKIFSPATPFGLPIGEDAAATAPVLSGGTGVNLLTTSGKVALVNTTNPVGFTTCALGNPEIVDFVGYGTSVCAEGGAGTPPTSVSLAVFRGNGGCTDTDNNAADFGTGAPMPRNSQTSVRNCAVTNPSGVTVASPASPCLNQSVTFTVTVTPGANPASTGIAVSGNFAALGGSASSAFAAQGGGVFTGSTIVGPAINFGNRFVPITITDAQGRTGLSNVTVTVIDCSLRGTAAASPPGVCNGEASLLTVAVIPGQSPASTNLTVSADLSSIGGVANQVFFDNGTNGDAVTGDNVYSFLATVPPGTADASSGLLAQIGDAQGRTATAPVTLAHAACTSSAAPVVISQMYGGGGGNGAPFNQDYIELFNRSQNPVDLAGWSIQYANNAGDFGTSGLIGLSGSIPPGGYYLIGMVFGGINGAGLPQTDIDGFIAMFNFSGKVALTNNTYSIGANCTDPSVVDLAAYGLPNTCFDGLAPAPELNNSRAALRKLGGCQDTNQNIIDFVAGVPSPRNSQSPTNVCTVTPPACPADLNHDGTLDPDDLADYIGAYFSVPPGAGSDFNADGTTDPDDLADYIGAFFSGCP